MALSEADHPPDVSKDLETGHNRHSSRAGVGAMFPLFPTIPVVTIKLIF